MAPNRFLAAIVARAALRPWTTLALALALTAAAIGYAATHFAMTSDATALIDARVPWRAAERRLDAAFPANGDAILAVVDAATPERAERAAAALTAWAAGDRAHVRAAYRPDGGAFFDANGLLFLPEPQVRATTARMIDAQPFLGPLAADPSLRGLATTLGTMLGGIARGEAGLDRIDPAMRALAEALDDQAAGRPAAFSWMRLLGDAKTAPTRRLVLIRPVLDYGALMPGAAAGDAIRAAARRHKRNNDKNTQEFLRGKPLQCEEKKSRGS